MKTIVFDMGGVLLPLEVQRCMDSFRRILGPQFDRLGLGSDGEGESVMAEYEGGRIGTDEFVGRILSWCLPGTTAEDVKRAWTDMLTAVPAERIEFIKKLRAEGYRVFLLSNTNELHWDNVIHTTPEFPDCFEHTFLSHLEKLSKPDPKFFRRITEYIGVRPSDIIFVDDLAANRTGAEKCGWSTCESVEALAAILKRQ